MAEIFPIVDDNGKTIGKATRKECHNGISFILHPVVHLHVFNSKGELYLQKRAANKDIQPNKWDTSVGGHVDYGEETQMALFREASEELSIKSFTPQFLLKYKFTSTQESELIHVYYTIFDGEITPDIHEISDGKFWGMHEIRENLEKDLFTPNFENEFLKISGLNLWPTF